MNENVINYLKEHRSERGLTQEELADLVGVSRQSINAIERGRYTPSLPLALRFALTFDCPVEQIFRLEGA